MIPQYMSPIVTIVLLLYLNGTSTTDFADSIKPIFGSKPKNLSPNVISRLESEWHNQYLLWQRRDLSKKKHLHFWVDGIYLQARMESEKNCILVIIGVDEYGTKKLIVIDDGFIESKEIWQGLLLDIKTRDLIHSPALAVGGGALGFWWALTEEYPTTVHQRCWVHKTSNILNKLRKPQQSKGKQMTHNIYMATSREEAKSGWKKFISAYSAKYPKATECLLKNEKELLAFYDFPGEQWIHLRTTNPIESTFVKVKHRTRKPRNCFSRNTIIAATYKSFLEAEKRWKHLRGRNRITQVINMEKFIDRIHENDISNDNLDEKKYVA